MGRQWWCAWSSAHSWCGSEQVERVSEVCVGRRRAARGGEGWVSTIWLRTLVVTLCTPLTLSDAPAIGRTQPHASHAPPPLLSPRHPSPGQCTPPAVNSHLQPAIGFEHVCNGQIKRSRKSPTPKRETARWRWTDTRPLLWNAGVRGGSRTAMARRPSTATSPALMSTAAAPGSDILAGLLSPLSC